MAEQDLMQMGRPQGGQAGAMDAGMDEGPGPGPEMDPEYADVRQDWVETAAAKGKEIFYGRGFEPMVQLFTGATKANFGKRMATILPRVVDVIEADPDVGQGSESEVENLGLALAAMLYGDLVKGGVIQDDPAMLVSALFWSRLAWMDAHPDRVDRERMMRQAQAAGTLPDAFDPAMLQGGAQGPQAAPGGPGAAPMPMPQGGPGGAPGGLLASLTGGM